MEGISLCQLIGLRETIRGKHHISWENLWFPIDFPLSPPIDYVCYGKSWSLWLNVFQPRLNISFVERIPTWIQAAVEFKPAQKRSMFMWHKSA